MPTETPVIVNQEYLQDIADAIRAKNNSNDTYTPAQMATAISNISGGGGETIPASAFSLSGYGSYLFSEDKWKYFVQNYTNDFNITNLASMQGMCQYVSYDMPATLTISGSGSMNNCFQLTGRITTIPTIINTGASDLRTMFSGSYLVAIPSNWFSNITLSQSSPQLTGMFERSCITGIVDLCCQVPANCSSTSRYIYNVLPFNTGTTCIWYGLSGLINIPIIELTASSLNTFSMTLSLAPYLKRLAFRTNNGTALTCQWKNMTMDLSQVGWWYGGVNKTTAAEIADVSYAWNDTSAIDALEITDATSYAQLKNTDGAWTQNADYSFYNKVSALETINSLPTVDGGTATIKFKGTAGQYTDGGAINTLTSAEIAIASAKGWTVTLV